MFSNDTCCTLVPYFELHAGKLDAFRTLGEQFVAKTRSETGCLHYAFSVSGQTVHCREGYDNAEGVLAHLDNVGGLLAELLNIAELTRLEVHAPATEIEKLRAPLAELNPQYFTLEAGGIRRSG